MEKSPVAHRQKRSWFRKQIVFPAEHGSWAWLLVPFAVGTAVAGQFNLAVTLVLIGGLAAFLMRQPATIWVRARQGKARRSHMPVAIRWFSGLGLVAVLCLAGLLISGHTAILWLSVPLFFLLGFYLGAARRRGQMTRTLWMEVAGAAGLAMMAPAAMIAARGKVDSQAWILWGLMAAQNVLGVFYVRLRIADTHERPSPRAPVLWSHVGAGTAVIVAAMLRLIPFLAMLPFLGFLIRAIWTYRRSRPIPNIKRFGFTEVGIEIASGLVIITGYLLLS